LSPTDDVHAAESAAERPGVRFGTLVVLGLMGAFGPLAMDVYIASLPQLAADLHASSSEVQATISGCLLGLAGGQLLAGPISDRIGRRPALIGGVALFLVTSVLCAIAPNIWLLIVFRVLQGIAGSAGISVSRAAIRDHFAGSEVARVLSRLTLITGVAPVAAPLIGGGLTLITDWRGVFGVLAGIGGLLLIAILIWVPESLRPENRLAQGIGAVFRQAGILFRDPVFVRYSLVGAAAGAAFFSYISMTSLVLQGEYHVNPVFFSVLFGINAVGLIIGAQLNTLLIAHLSLRRALVVVLIAAFVVLACDALRRARSPARRGADDARPRARRERHADAELDCARPQPLCEGRRDRGRRPGRARFRFRSRRATDRGGCLGYHRGVDGRHDGRLRLHRARHRRDIAPRLRVVGACPTPTTGAYGIRPRHAKGVRGGSPSPDASTIRPRRGR